MGNVNSVTENTNQNTNNNESVHDKIKDLFGLNIKDSTTVQQNTQEILPTSEYVENASTKITHINQKLVLNSNEGNIKQNNNQNNDDNNNDNNDRYESSNNVTIYVLKLIDDKYYVGKSKHYKFRLKDHFNHSGSAWTMKYKPTDVLELFHNCDDFDEDKYTIKFMKEYGIDNVRGGSFCELTLNDENRKTIKRMIKGSTDACHGCGEIGHFIKKCPKVNNVNSNVVIKSNTNNNAKSNDVDDVNDVNEEMFQIVSTISEIDANQHSSFGTSIIALILKGSEEKRIQPWMKDLTYYGKMKMSTIEQIKNYVLMCKNMNYIEEYVVYDYPTLKCTQKGIDFCKKYTQLGAKQKSYSKKSAKVQNAKSYVKLPQDKTKTSFIKSTKTKQKVVCFRCGRNTHLANACYATIHIDGSQLT